VEENKAVRFWGKFEGVVWEDGEVERRWERI